MTKVKYTTRQANALNTLEYRLYLERDEQVISPFHDVPLYADKSHGIVNMFVEIPRWTNGKLEISKEEPMNPVKQDVKKGALRFVKSIFPHHGYPWNYGALPQTWECPDRQDPSTGMKGDNDPIDAVEIGTAVLPTGAVRRVKVLGAMALLDEGETDWKIFVIDCNDPLAEKLDDIPDVERHCPGLVEATRRWFRDYKIPDGKPANAFAFDGAVKGRDFALKVIEETHESWRKLIDTEADSTRKIDLKNRLGDNQHSIGDADIGPAKQDPVPPAAVDPSVSSQVYLH